ncbi:MAG TPA: hypothetical protein VGF30_02525, partial [Bacteroidia bacterium]
IEKIEKIEMNLSAFGVESDDFPSVDAVIDFIKDSSSCVKSFYNPEKKGSSYSLDKDEMQEILNLLQISEVQKLKTEYKVSISDQPNSTTIIYTNKTKYVIKDYGLCGEGPLRKLYGIVYRIIL